MKSIKYLALIILIGLSMQIHVKAQETYKIEPHADTEEDEEAISEENIKRDSDGHIIGIYHNGVYLDMEAMTKDSTRTYDDDGNVLENGYAEGTVPTDVEDEYSEEELKELESGEILNPESTAASIESKETESINNLSDKTSEEKLDKPKLLFSIGIAGIIISIIAHIVYKKRSI